MPSTSSAISLDPPTGPRTLGHNEFYGLQGKQATVGGFAFARRRADPDVRVLRHSHETAHFVLLLRGAYITTARNAPAVCTSPTLIYNPPGTTHRDRFAEGCELANGRFLSIAIDPEALRVAADAERLIDAPTCLRNSKAVEIAERLARELSSSDGATPLVHESLCVELLAYAARDTAPAVSAEPPWLAQAAELLREQCAEGVTVAEIARIAGVHPVHLARAFRRFLYCSPGEYLRHCRIQRAALRLRDSRHSLASIALASGFADQSHFTKAFVAAYDLTPGAYRRAHEGRAYRPDDQVA